MRLLRQLKIFLPLYKGFFKRYKWHILFLIGLGFLLGFLEGVGIGMLIPLFSFIAGESKFGEDFISNWIEKIFGYLNIEPSLGILMTIFISLFMVSAALDFLFGYIDNKISVTYERKLMSSLYKRMLYASWPFLLKQKIGHLEHIMMVGVPNQTKLIKKVFVIIETLTGFSMYFLIAYKISPFVTIITTSIGGLLIILFKPLISRSKIYMVERAQVGKGIAHDINENVTGLKTIKIMGIEDEVGEQASIFFKKLMDLAVKQFIVGKIANVFWKPFTLIFVSIVFVITYTYNRETFDLAAFVAVIYLIQRIFMHISGIYGVITTINMSLPYAQMVAHLQREAYQNQEKDAGRGEVSFSQELEFREVKFSYKSEIPVLSNVSFRVRKGEMIGIIGRSGMGKTTICDLFLRLFEPDEGGIFVDGGDIREFRIDDWRNSIGYVSQDIFLKNSTIENNIKFFDESVTDEQMIEAAKIANIYDFVQGLPKGFKTGVGERGTLLSGGQRQRIILARVLVRKPKILLLDEATSALDNESEALVQDAIEKLKQMGNMTIIAIAHRLTTVMRSNRLLVLDDGRIVEEGSPDELLKDKESQFYKMYNLR